MILLKMIDALTERAVTIVLWGLVIGVGASVIYAIMN
jgi:hypothetical protein